MEELEAGWNEANQLQSSSLPSEGFIETDWPVVAYGHSYIRPEWALVIGTETRPRHSRLAQTLLTITQITRDAVRFLRHSNSFLQQIEAPCAPLTHEAHARSMELLESWLSPEQLASFKERSSFEVTGSAAGRYRLRPKYSFGIEVLEGALTGCSLCVVPQGASALGDILLAQKIALETNEEATLELANVSRMRPFEYSYAELDRELVER